MSNESKKPYTKLPDTIPAQIANRKLRQDDDVAFKFSAMHFGIEWELRQKQLRQEKPPCYYFDIIT